MYVSNEGSNTVSVVTGSQNAANIPVGPAPLQGAYDPYGGLFYVPDSGTNEISILSGASLDTNVRTQASPLTPAFDPLNGYMYVPNNGGCDIAGNANGTCGNTVSVISGVSVVTNITVGTAPMEPVVDTNINSPYYGYVYVPNAVSQTISVISGTNNVVVATIGSGPTYPVLVPRPPGGGVYDPSDDTVYMGSFIIHGVDAIGELPTLSMPNLVIHPNEAPPQFQVSCTTSCVYDPYNGLVYEPSDPYQPVFGGFIVINGTGATASSCADCGAPGAVFNPQNGWIYMGSEVISGDTPFALASPVSGAFEGAQSYDPDLGGIYGVTSASAVLLGNSCGQVGGEYNYSAVDLDLCNKGGSFVTAATTTIAATNTGGGVNAGGSHVFSIVTSGNIPMASGNWTASGSNIIDQQGGATISFSLTGQTGSRGTATITVLKSEVVFLLGAAALSGTGSLPSSKNIASWLPQLYIDGQQVTDATLTQDSTNIYITFPIHFSTHQIQLKWIPAALAVGTNGTALGNSTSQSSISSSQGVSATSSVSASISKGMSLSLSNYYVVVVVISIGIIGGGFVLSGRKRGLRPSGSGTDG
jgi:YVTN family beta-propeller protein